MARFRGITRKDNPCYQCPDRTAECHTYCEKYKEYSAKCEELRKKKAMISQIYSPRAGVMKANRKHWLDEKRGNGKR